MVAGVELTYNRNASAQAMANAIFGDGVTVNDARLNADPDRDASAIFSNGNGISPGVVPSDTGVILSTGDVRAFTSTGSQSNFRSNTTSSNSGPNNDPLFNALAGGSTFDASYLEVDFTPDPGVNFITMEFVFSSEEYPEYAGSIYNDMVGVWIDGNVVPLAAGTGVASVGNINQSGGINLFKSNTGDQFNTEMDGFTVSMSVTVPVTPGQENTLRIGVADVADSQYDSNLLIAANSVQGTLVAVEDRVLLRPGDSKVVDVQANDLNLTGGIVVITRINDIPVSPGDSVTLNTGQTITLNADGTLSMVGNTASEDVAFTYEVESSTGDTAVGFINVDTVPCFVAGTMIRTPRGERPVEKLKVGQRVMTLDNGPQVIRWIGRRRLPAQGPMAPIRIAPGVLGATRALHVSPLHRLLLQNEQAELLYGSCEILAAARDLVGERGITRREGGMVEYFHLLFDDHQMIWSDGLLSESFLPGPQTTHCFEPERIAEIRSIFPDLDPRTGAGYGPAARPALKRYEARLLVA
ncbi:MAG: Hint domain-containing protein [Silicimonas sp.]|nr:Hint domain-containing protein [Silicimonas sp.]